MKSKIIICFLALLMLVSCGTPVADEPENIVDENIASKHEYTPEDFAEFLPEGYSVYDWKDAGNGLVFAVAKESETSKRQIILLRKGALVKVSEPFPAAAVEFGSGKSWGVKLDESTLGYAVAFDLGTGDIPGYFVKVFSDKTYEEIPCDLGPGYVARDFYDLDGTGFANLLMINIKWADVSSEIIAGQPFTQAVCRYENGRFVDDTPNHPNQMEPGLDQFKAGIQGTDNEADALYYAICLMITMDAMGNRDEAVEGFSTVPQRILDKDRRAVAQKIADHVSNLKSYEMMNPPWFNPVLEPAWELLKFNTIQVK